MRATGNEAPRPRWLAAGTFRLLLGVVLLTVAADRRSHHSAALTESHDRSVRYFGQAISIGRSVEGRAIRLFRFGRSDRPVVLLLGGQHGSEATTIDLLSDFATHLENHPGDIPKAVQLWFVPVMNPDGFARGQRTNANGVDLNRNFDTRDWQPNTRVNSWEVADGGGVAPLSEPESRALAALLLRNRPRILYVVNVHCCGRVVLSDRRSAMARRLARTLARESGLRHIESWSAYPVTGSLQTWLSEDLGLPYVFVELRGGQREPFAALRPALLQMLEATEQAGTLPKLDLPHPG